MGEKRGLLYNVSEWIFLQGNYGSLNLRFLPKRLRVKSIFRHIYTVSIFFVKSKNVGENAETLKMRTTWVWTFWKKQCIKIRGS